jgi:hypothetical protein
MTGSASERDLRSLETAAPREAPDSAARAKPPVFYVFAEMYARMRGGARSTLSQPGADPA